jgi:hypothetical protein
VLISRFMVVWRQSPQEENIGDYYDLENNQIESQVCYQQQASYSGNPAWCRLRCWVLR